MKRLNIGKMLVAMAMVSAGVAAAANVVVPEIAWADDSGKSVTSSVLSVSPTYKSIILNPGQTYTGVVTVSNPADAKGNLKYTAHVGSYVKTGDGEGESDSWTADTDKRESYNEIMDWITLSNETGELAPNESRDITYTINVPENAPGGGQYAAVLVANDTDTGGGGGNVMIDEKTQIASYIYADVAGLTESKGEILSNNIPGFLTTPQLDATSSVQNDGNVHTNAKYVLQVWPAFGSDEEICTNEEDPAETQVMPQTKQFHTETCNLKAMAGIFKAKQTVTIFGETSIVEKYLVLCPLWLMIVILVVIIAIIGFFVFRARGRKSRRI